MARGWESKAVESQQADLARRTASAPSLSAEARARAERVRSLSLALARVRDQLQSATQPGHRTMLEQAAASLDAEIATLESE